jgi:hypothetical protein
MADWIGDANEPARVSVRFCPTDDTGCGIELVRSGAWLGAIIPRAETRVPATGCCCATNGGQVPFHAMMIDMPNGISNTVNISRLEAGTSIPA